MNIGLPALGQAALAAFMIAALSWPSHGRAENHALILWIGQYADPTARLPGIDLDAKAARKIAHAMGVPDANIMEMKNEQLTWKGLSKAIGGLTDHIKQGDKVFFYFSGHGYQMPNPAPGSSKKCSEGLVAQDKLLYFDSDLEADLARLGAKASQVVMMNDSCFSGGASEKSLPAPGRRLVPKAYPGMVGTIDKSASAVGGGKEQACGTAVNKGLLSKNIEVVQRRGARLLYIAAAGNNEVSFATPDGSLATQAWLACIEQPKADKDGSGAITGEELRACAQSRIDGNKDHVRQHVTLTGTEALPVSFLMGDAQGSSTPVNAKQALQDLRSASDRAYNITLTPARRSLRIGQDPFDFTVETNREGYLYILQAGSDGKDFNQLFPNQVDSNNHVLAGKHRFPRAAWAMRSAGPAGTNYLIAVLSPEPKDFSAQMDRSGTFASTPVTRSAVKNIAVVATGARAGGQGRYGASEVVPIAETP